MISPDLLLKDVLDLLNKYSDEIGISKAQELSEEKSGNLKAPYIGAWADFADDAEGTTMGGEPLLVPVEIKLLVVGAPAKTLQQSFSAAFNIALAATQKVRGYYVIGNNRYQLRVRPKMFDIWGKRKESTMILINLFYQDKLQ